MDHSWPLLDVRTADTRVGVHSPVGGCTTSTDRDCGAIVDEKEHFFAVVGDSVCDSSDAGRGAAKAKTLERRTAVEKKTFCAVVGNSVCDSSDAMVEAPPRPKR